MLSMSRNENWYKIPTLHSGLGNERFSPASVLVTTYRRPGVRSTLAHAAVQRRSKVSANVDSLVFGHA